MGAEDESVVVVAPEELRREAPSFEAGREPPPFSGAARKEDELTVRGVTGGLSAEEALPARESGSGFGLDAAAGGLGVAGLFQELKKSSSPPPLLSWEVGVETSGSPSTKIPAGNLLEL